MKTLITLAILIAVQSVAAICPKHVEVTLPYKPETRQQKLVYAEALRRNLDIPGSTIIVNMDDVNTVKKDAASGQVIMLMCYKSTGVDLGCFNVNIEPSSYDVVRDALLCEGTDE